MKTAILLVNLGTPDNTSKKAIKSYLREFLADYRVINLPRLLRFLLVNAVIIPFRSSKTRHAYQSIWTSEGSPLLSNSRKLQQKLRLQLNPYTPETKQDTPFEVFLAMRYGNPNIKDVLTELQHNNFTRIIIVPLYPQYASASSGSALEKCLKHLSDFRYFPKIICLNEFYSFTGYIQSLANSIRSFIEPAQPNNHILFSYHGIPKQQLEVTNITKPACNDNQSCLQCDYSPTCYRAQCYVTSKLVAEQLFLPTEQYSTAFQSRLGKLPWVKPYTDEVIKQLRERGVTNLTVVCPSFVVDCLETLEEIGLRLKEEWLKIGGQTFTLVPCLNDNDDWIKNLAELIKQ